MFVSLACQPAVSAADPVPQVPEVVQTALKSVVHIETDREFIVKYRPAGFMDVFAREFSERPDWEERKLEMKGAGTGVLIDETGLILTNAHVIRGAGHIKVVTSDEREYKGEIVGRSSEHDLALVQIHPVGEPPAVVMGDSRALQTGQDVLALGSPYGLKFSVTKGVVSALDRSLKIGNRTILENMIQTDVSVNPGNSGGPLIDTEGRMVGILTAGHRGGSGINFAIPVHVIQKLIPEMKEDREALDGIDRLQKRYGITFIVFDDEGPESEFLITDVDIRSQAWTAGIRPDDVLVSFNGRPARSLKGLIDADKDVATGERVHLVIRRIKREFFTYVEVR